LHGGEAISNHVLFVRGEGFDQVYFAKRRERDEAPWRPAKQYWRRFPSRNLIRPTSQFRLESASARASGTLLALMKGGEQPASCVVRPYFGLLAALPIAFIKELPSPDNHDQPLLAPSPATMSGITVANVPAVVLLVRDPVVPSPVTPLNGAGIHPAACTSEASARPTAPSCTLVLAVAGWLALAAAGCGCAVVVAGIDAIGTVPGHG